MLGMEVTPYQTRHSGPSIDRQSPKLQVPVGGPKERTMACPKVSHAVREECPTCIDMGKDSSGRERLCPELRGRPWGNSPGKKGSSKAYRKQQVKNAYVMDLFAGEAGVTKACIAMGFKAKFWDLRYGAHHDLTKKATLQRIRKEIKGGKVIACMLAPVCTSFSVARDRTKVIRNREYPWGIPAELLSEKEATSISIGNSCFRACLRILRWLDEYKIPYILENPATSKAWYLPPIVNHLKKPHVNFVTCHFCQYGTAWEKPTSFLCGHIHPSDLHRITKVCHGRGICSRSHKAHFQLSGSRNDGTPWTKVAEPYPAKLCRDLAYTLTSHLHTLSTKQFLSW